MEISQAAIEAIQNYKMPAEFGFGKVISPVMVCCDYKNGTWGPLQLLPYAPLTLKPVAKVFHYGQEIFEGLKAYAVDGKGPLLFRPEQNARRFNLSAARMAMPLIPEEMFLAAVESITSYSHKFIPTQTGESLYIRPFMIATEESLGIKPSEEFKFLVVASPSGSYFNAGTLKVLIEREATRAAPGGTGAAKTGGNYAASLISAQKVQKLGYSQTLWLDAREHRKIEEMSGMNFFAVINGVLTTPALTDSILEGITRKSILQLAVAEGYKISEESMDIGKLTEQILSGECTEAFACGTAAIITPIASLHEADGTSYSFKDSSGKLGTVLKGRLLDIQEGRSPGPDGWMRTIHPAEID